MKRELINFIAVLGLIMLGTAAVLGVLTGILFVFPKASIFGARAVKERDTEMIYVDAEFAEAFASGKLILESYGTQIEVKMSNEIYNWPNTVIVHESATGIAFNSLNRTLVSCDKTRYHDETYYHIKVMEPSGLIFNGKPTTVTLNLPYRSDDFQYDFVLQNHYSPVTFGFRDETPTAQDKILINNLVVESAGSVTIPYAKNNSVNTVTIAGDKINEFNCETKVLGNVYVTGNDNKKIEFGCEREDEVTGVAGNIIISGNNNNFTGTNANNVKCMTDKGDPVNGSLKMTGTIASLLVNTERMNVSLAQVTGQAKMYTKSGSLTAESIGGGLEFYPGLGSEPTATADLDVKCVTGTVKVENYGTGSVNLADVAGDVDITSKEANGGEINVAFREEAGAHTVKIVGYDGDINVTGINGGDVTIESYGQFHGGFANVKTEFVKVGTAVIKPSGDTLHTEQGSVEIRLRSGCNTVVLDVEGASSFDLDDESVNVKQKTIGSNGTAGSINVTSWNNVRVYTEQ